MGRNKGQFGTAHRSVKDHEATLRLAAQILATECGTKHKLGERTDLCPKCRAGRTTLNDPKLM
jgi:hypothetical protein